MNSLIFCGFLTNVGPLYTIETAHGQMNKREIVITTNEEYPQSIAAELTGDNALNFCGTIGQQVSAYLKFTTSTAQSGRVFNNVRAWRIDIH